MRCLRILTRPNVGGPMRQALALWHAHAAAGLQTLLVVGSCSADETEVDVTSTGVPWLSFEQAVHDGTQAKGIVQIEDMGRNASPLRDVRALRSIRQLVHSFAPDVVHTHTSKAGALGRLAVSRRKVKVIAHTYHGHVLRDYFNAPVSAGLRSLERLLARRTQILFAVSPSCRDELVELGIAPAERFQVVPPAVDWQNFSKTSREEARQLLGAPPDRTLLAFVGRLAPVKRPEMFIEMLRDFPEAEGHVFGAGELGRTLMRRAPARTQFHEDAPNLAQVLPAFDMLVLPSVREGCPLIAVEAFAAGVPVMGFDVPGLRDALRQWGAGVLVAPDAGVAGLVRSGRTLLKDQDFRAGIIARAKQGLGKFLPERVAGEIMAAYRRALAEHPESALVASH